jgi:hypothetical protein
MVNYQNGKIYKIVSSQTDKVYIGSTTKDKLCQRMAGHRGSYKSYLKDEHNYITSFEIIKHEDAKIILIEAFPCNNSDELHARERYYIENTNNCVNKQVPSSNKKESDKRYYEMNKEQINEKNKEYYENNKEQINTQRNEKLFCVCGGQYTRRNKAQHEKSKKHSLYINKNT